MDTVNDIATLRASLDMLRKNDQSLALVPTMGALHAGHMQLVEHAKSQADHVAVSIFVNPTQFGAGEDLDAYPRQMAADQAKLEQAGVKLLWAPTEQEMYPDGFQTVINVPDTARGLCGEKRPGHFDGVATVVCKLLQQVQPDIALFGEKDYQQLAVIRTMVRDLDIPITILGVATVRENDGLAMSSRNAYLTTEQRAAASVLPNSMKAAIANIEQGKPIDDALSNLIGALKGGGFHAVDYAELRMAATLETPDPAKLRGGEALRLLVAAHIGATRLIDNMPLNWPKNSNR